MNPSTIRRTLLLSCIFCWLYSPQLHAQTFLDQASTPTDNNGQAGPTVSVTPPGSMQNGDLVVIYAHYRGNLTLNMSATGGQTWNTGTTYADATNSQSFAIFWATFNGTWTGADPSVTAGAGNTLALSVMMYVFEPTITGSTWGVHVAAANSSATDATSPYTFPITGLTTTVPNTVTMAFWASADDNQWGTLSGTGWSKSGLSGQYRNTSGSDMSHTAAYNIRTTAGSVANVSQVQTANGTDFTRTSIMSWYQISPPPPANDLCANAIALTSSSSCNTTSGTLSGATYTSLTNTCSYTNSDVWYSFTANGSNETITLGGTLGTNGRFQVFTAASCGGAENQAYCSSSNSALVTGLTQGQQYLVRVFSNNASSSGFTICITDPAPATLDYGKSYANITRNNGGGTIRPGDTLEIRATLVVRTLAVDSLSFIDTLGKGLNYVPGSMAVRTNEGKIYRWDNTNTATPPAYYTDNFDSDAGYVYTYGADSIIRINIGTGSRGTARGKLRHNTAPRIGSATSSTANSVIMATYRVVVDTAYSALLNLGGGYFTARDSASGSMRVMSFLPRSAVVYQTPGLCPNSLSPSNAIADEFGGTFGSAVLAPVSGRPLKNRTASANVPGYIYTLFGTGTPNDYYYGISNNTGSGGTNFTNVNTWPKSGTVNRRVHNLWDISGDHTGASNAALGNPPCDTTQPVSASNPCGYMLVVNSAYKTDTAFQYNISNLCPNTYYEISFWVKNICSKCGSDSLGRSSTATGYVPLETGDTSGVRPNLAIDINGIDYYTTGQINYVGTGVAQTLQDNTNTWVKRGFTYLTSSTPGVLTMSIRNTAPGGGGNDWALDDISVATCFPNMNYSPSLTPNVCESNALTIYDTVRSYFNNYTYYKWQRSTNGGSTWSDITSPVGPVSTTVNGSFYQYVSQYTIPPSQTVVANNGNRYRLITATTSANLSSNDCISTDALSIVTLNVLDCTPILATTLLSFNGKLVDNFANLSWVTTKEEASVTYIIEKSTDQLNFFEIGRMPGNNNAGSEKNYYSFADPAAVSGKVLYRIVLVTAAGKKEYSRTILLNSDKPEFGFGNVINPFANQLFFDITSQENTKIDVTLIDINGKPVLKKNYVIYGGTNSLSLDNTNTIAAGIYTLKVEKKDITISKRVMKRN